MELNINASCSVCFKMVEQNVSTWPWNQMRFYWRGAVSTTALFNLWLNWYSTALSFYRPGNGYIGILLNRLAFFIPYCINKRPIAIFVNGGERGGGEGGAGHLAVPNWRKYKQTKRDKVSDIAHGVHIMVDKCQQDGLLLQNMPMWLSVWPPLRGWYSLGSFIKF